MNKETLFLAVNLVCLKPALVLFFWHRILHLEHDRVRARNPEWFDGHRSELEAKLGRAPSVTRFTRALGGVAGAAVLYGMVTHSSRTCVTAAFGATAAIVTLAAIQTWRSWRVMRRIPAPATRSASLATHSLAAHHSGWGAAVLALFTLLGLSALGFTASRAHWPAVAWQIPAQAFLVLFPLVLAAVAAHGAPTFFDARDDRYRRQALNVATLLAVLLNGAAVRLAVLPWMATNISAFFYVFIALNTLVVLWTFSGAMRRAWAHATPIDSAS